MSDLPVQIRDFIVALTDDTRAPAYMLVNQVDKLTEWGGDLESYGIDGLKRDMHVSEHIAFLAGLLPLGRDSVFLPRVQTKTDVFADVYLFSREQGTWILLLDATIDSARRQTMQQKVHDSQIHVAELEREGGALLEANIVLEQLVRERTAELAQTVLQLKQQLAESERAKKAGQDN